MATQNFQSPDFLLTNGCDLRVSKPYSLFQTSKPEQKTLTASSVSGNNIILTASAALTGVEIPKNLELNFGGILAVTTSKIILNGTSDVIPVLDATGISTSVTLTIAPNFSPLSGNNDILLTNTANQAGIEIDAGSKLTFSGTYTLTVSGSPSGQSITLADAAANAGVYLAEGTELTFTSGTAVIGQDTVLTGVGDVLLVSNVGSVANADTATYAPSITTTVIRTVTLDGVSDQITVANDLGLVSGMTCTYGGSAAIYSQLASVYSINQADSTVNQNEIEDRNFRSGIWVSRRTTNRSANISLSGVYVKNDPGLSWIREASRTIRRVYFELQEGSEASSSDYGLQGWATVNDFQETRQNDQHKQISFTLNVDGELLDYVAA